MKILQIFINFNLVNSQFIFKQTKNKNHRCKAAASCSALAPEINNFAVPGPDRNGLGNSVNIPL
jgi:hypothetical protein